MNRVNRGRSGSARLWVSVLLVVVLLGVWSATVAGDNNAPPTGAQLSAAPSMPENVQASQGTQVDHVRVTWPAVSGATYYRVYSTLTGGVNWPERYPSPTTNVYLDTGATHNFKWDYRVRACNSDGCSAYSWPPVTGWSGLAAPTNVQASDGTYDNMIRVTWNAVAAAKLYRVYKSRNTMGWEWESFAHEASWEDSAVTPGTLYYWWVKACNDITCSAFSSSDTGYRRLGIPTGVTASNGAYCDRVRVEWAPTQGATYYEVSRATSTGSSRVEFTATGSPFDDTTAPSSAYWYYWVRACAPTGCGYWSTPVSGYRGAPPPPVHIASTQGNYPDRVGVSWTPVNGATTYQLYRGTSSVTMPLLASGISAASYDDYTIQCGTTYYYGVAACNACGCGARYGNVTGWTQCPPPASPTNTPIPTNTSRPANTATPTNTPQATNTPTNTPRPTNTSRPANTATPTNTPRPTSTDDPGRTRTPEPIATNTPRPTSTGTLEARPSSTPTLPVRPTAIWTPVSWLYLPMVIK